jgi:hypothetical protein
MMEQDFLTKIMVYRLNGPRLESNEKIKATNREL